MVLLALLPIIWLIVALGFLKLPGYKACPVAVIISAVVAVAAFGMPGTDAATAFLEGVALAVWPILLVIVAAIFAYNLTVYTKSMDVIKQMLTTVSKDSRILALLIAWGFGAFMEGMAGFGTAVAIPASIMVGLGYNPLRSILACLIANTVPTTFGSNPEYALDIEPKPVSSGAGVKAAMIFILIFVFLILTSKLFPFINGPLSTIKTSVPIYTGAGAKPYTFMWVATPGIMILLAAIIGGKYQGASFGEIFGKLKDTIYNLRFTFLTIITVVATAKLMAYSGMTMSIAKMLVSVTGTAYPAFAPIAGALGAFITGSGTNSNVLFGPLQTAAAQDIPGASAAWLAACNSAGAGVGKMLSPQSIAIAIGAVGAAVEGKESEIMKMALPYFIGGIIILGLVTYFGQMILA